MDRRKWNLSELPSAENHDSTAKNSIAINLLFNPHGVKQFYQFHIHEKIWTNGSLHRNEIKKLLHLTIDQDRNGINQIHLESFDRIHFDRNLALSEKEYLDNVASILDDVKLEVNKYGVEYQLKNHSEIHLKSKRTLEKLQKNYVGGNAERQFRFLKTFYANPKLILKDLLNYKQYGLLLPKFYGHYDVGQEKEYAVRFTQLMENMVVRITEKVQINTVDEEKKILQLQVKGQFSEEINTETCRFILTNRNIGFSENDKAVLNNYQGNFEISKGSGLVKNSELNIEFSFGENYRKNILYSLKSIDYEEA